MFSWNFFNCRYNIINRTYAYLFADNIYGTVTIVYSNEQIYTRMYLNWYYNQKEDVTHQRMLKKKKNIENTDIFP